MKKLLFTLCAAALMPIAASAQSSYEVIDSTSTSAQTTQNSISLDELTSLTPEDKAYVDSFNVKLQKAGDEINTVSAQWDAEKAKRGYPKKKTVKAKAAAVDAYVELLRQQLSDTRLNRFIDKDKVQSKIDYWEDYRVKLNKLM